MATLNLVSKSLGDILTESGNGVPDHTSPKGSLYVDIDGNSLYTNLTGGTNWESYSMVSYGEAFYMDANTATTITTQNVWTAVGNNFSSGYTENFTINTDRLILDSGCDGLFEINGSITIVHVAGTPEYDAGISLNDNLPVNCINSGIVAATTKKTANIAFVKEAYLTGGTEITISIRNTTDTNNIIIRHAQLTAHRIK